jgi:serine/threonine protein kinase
VPPPPPSLELEYLPGGTLRDHLNARRYFSGVECVYITRQTTSGLAHLHALDITQRDISDNNILIERRGPEEIVVKLADLGMSKEGSELNTIVGTPYYFAPEFFGNRTSNGRRTVEGYTKDVDTWSLGAVLARLRCGFPMYTDAHHKDGTLWCRDIRRRLAQ